MGTTISVGVDSLILSTFQATVESDVGVDIGVSIDNLVLTTFPATVQLDANIAATTDALFLITHRATIGAGDDGDGHIKALGKPMARGMTRSLVRNVITE